MYLTCWINKIQYTSSCGIYSTGVKYNCRSRWQGYMMFLTEESDLGSTESQPPSTGIGRGTRFHIISMTSRRR